MRAMAYTGIGLLAKLVEIKRLQFFVCTVDVHAEKHVYKIFIRM